MFSACSNYQHVKWHKDPDFINPDGSPKSNTRLRPPTVSQASTLAPNGTATNESPSNSYSDTPRVAALPEQRRHS